MLTADSPAIPKSRAPFNSKPWLVHLEGTGYSSKRFAAAVHSVELVSNPVRAAKLLKAMKNASLGPHIRDEGGLTLVSLPLSIKSDGVSLSGSVQLGKGNGRTIRPMSAEELETLRPEVETYLNGLDPASHAYKSMRYDQTTVPYTVETALLTIGKAYIDGANFDCDHFRNRSMVHYPHISLSAPLILHGTATEGVYDRALFMGNKKIEALTADEDSEVEDAADEDAAKTPPFASSLARLQDETISQLEAIRPSQVSDDHWSALSAKLVVQLLEEADQKFTQSQDEIHSLTPSVSTWDCSAAGDRPCSVANAAWPYAQAKSTSPDQATHILAMLIQNDRDASDATPFTNSSDKVARNMDFFDIPKSVASTE